MIWSKVSAVPRLRSFDINKQKVWKFKNGKSIYHENIHQKETDNAILIMSKTVVRQETFLEIKSYHFKKSFHLSGIYITFKFVITQSNDSRYRKQEFAGQKFTIEVFYVYISLTAFDIQAVKKNQDIGSSLVVQWLRLCAPNARDLGSIPGWGTRSHLLQLKIAQWRSYMPQLKPGVVK